MSTMSLPRRAAQAVADSPISERVAEAQTFVYGSVLDWARRSPLHSGVLGHSLHPVLTDLTLGFWTSASLLDVVGGPSSRHAATLLTGAGVAAAIPTAVAGAADWAGRPAAIAGSAPCTPWAPTSRSSCSRARLQRGCAVEPPPGHDWELWRAW